jgi:hypothetical protein
MSYQKFVLVPSESVSDPSDPNTNTEPNPPEKKRIERDAKKLRKLLNIILKIGLNNSYTEDFEIKDKFGKPIRDSDISALLNHAIIPQKILVGENDFIRILYDSKVDPNWIVNENLRLKLLNYRPTHQSPPRSPPKSPPPKPTTPPPETQSADPTTVLGKKGPNLSIKQLESHSITPTVKQPVKRKIVDPSEGNKRQRSLDPWLVPLPDDDDDDL